MKFNKYFSQGYFKGEIINMSGNLVKKIFSKTMISSLFKFIEDFILYIFKRIYFYQMSFILVDWVIESNQIY